MTDDNPPIDDREPDPRSELARRTAWWALIVIAAVVAVVALALGIAAFVPDAGLFSGVGSLAFPALGPWVFVLAVVATGFAFWRRRRGSPRRTATGVLGVGAAAAALNLVLIVVFCVQVANAGGSVNPVRALGLGSMNSIQPDVVTSYTTPDGRHFPAAIWRPKPSTTSAPVLFYIHGGGWVSGGANDGGAEWDWFARHGWLVVSVGYQLATRTDHTWNQAPQQLACGLAWANTSVTRWSGDPSRLVVAGDSAGGNLAVNLAYGVAKGMTTSTCGPMPAIRAAAVQYPVVDPVGTWNAGFAVGSDVGSDARAFLTYYTGGSPSQYPDRYRAIASRTYLSAKAPPTLVISPDHDSLIPPAGVRAFVDQARAAGVRVTRVDIPFANHAYDALATHSLGNQARLSITENFLRPLVRP